MAISGAEHQAIYKKRHPERVRASAAKYRAKNKAKIAAHGKTPQFKYSNHMFHARQRGVEWGFTFETWWEMWEPYFDQMGQTSDSYHMCRTRDVGPYSPENCRIDTAANNGREGVETKYRGVKDEH